jgi:hypothetical protein
MNRSIALAAFTLAGLFSTLNAQASQPAASIAQSSMCQETTHTVYTRQNHGPAGKSAEIVKETKRTRLVCNEGAVSKKPARTAALMRHYKSA